MAKASYIFVGFGVGFGCCSVGFFLRWWFGAFSVWCFFLFDLFVRGGGGVLFLLLLFVWVFSVSSSFASSLFHLSSWDLGKYHFLSVQHINLYITSVLSLF